jgi:hypothetical protein
MYSRSLGIGAIVASLALLLGVGSAAGFNGATSITLDRGGPNGAEGHLTAGPRCEAGRKVTLFLLDPQSGSPTRVGSALTDGNGDWEVKSTLFKGDYQAVVESKRVKVHGKRRTCRGARSLETHL